MGDFVTWLTLADFFNSSEYAPRTRVRKIKVLFLQNSEKVLNFLQNCKKCLKKCP